MHLEAEVQDIYTLIHSICMTGLCQDSKKTCRETMTIREYTLIGPSGESERQRKQILSVTYHISQSRIANLESI